MESFIAHWGYLALVLGCMFEGETIVLLGGFMAHKGLLGWQGVVLSAYLGSLVGDQGWFLTGRYLGQRWFSRWRHFREASQRVARWSKGPSGWFVLVFRFIYGIRSVTPFALGGMHYPVKKFLVLNGLGAALWSFAICALGWFMGDTVERLLGRTARVEEILAVGAALVVLGWWLHRRQSRPTTPEPGE